MIRNLLLAAFFLITTGYSLFGQCSISAKREACVDDIVTFNLTAGGSVTAYNWNFGTYGTSSNTSPLMKFTAAGNVTVTCTATISGQSCIDTHTITIHPNPKAKAVISSSSRFCLNDNYICLNDSSLKSARGFYSISMLWGDGNLNQYTSPLPKQWCHKYSDTGTYQFDMEIADSVGCKDKFKLNIRVAPSVSAQYTNTETQLCDSVRVCVKNTTEGSGIKSTWYSEGKKLSDAIQYCKVVQPGKTENWKLITMNNEGCKDSAEYQISVPKSQFYLEQADSVVCINELYNGKLLFFAGEEVQWKLNGISEYIDNKYIGYDNARLGMNYVTAHRIGGCTGTLKDSFLVIGVRAVGRVWNSNRRRVQDTVFLLDLTKGQKGTKLSRMWDFGDQYAPQCTTWTAKGLNVGRNCNFSRDSLARHFYPDTGCYAPRLIITDSVTMCYDDTLIPVYRQDACPRVFMPGKVCLGDYAGFTLPGNMYQKVQNKNFLIVDTAKGADTIVLWNGYGRYLYKKTGNYSPVLWRFYGPDTVWTEKGGKMVVWFIRNGDGWVADTFIHEVNVVERSNSDFTVVKISECNPFSGRLTFTDSIWRNPGQLTINWGDTLITYSGFTDSVVVLKPLIHNYKSAGFYTIEVVMMPTKGCNNSTVKSIAFSHQTDFSVKARCWNEAVCFKDSIFNTEDNKRWTKTNGQGKLWWDFGDGKSDTGYGVCHIYNSPGTYKIKLTAISKFNCTAVQYQTVVLSKPIALIRHQPTIYCSDIRQYFDSSLMLHPDGVQKISQWKWEFMDGTAPVFVKNPAHIFPGGGVYPVKLTVTTSLGCKDSVVKNFTVIGPQVSAAIISDSIGCAPLTVDFGNQSKQTKSFIWEFGDKNNTFYSTENDSNVRFIYKDAGVFFVHITGGDSFLNPTTGSKYYCSVRYPAPGQKPLRITVFETARTGFNVPSVLCVNDTAVIENTSSNNQIKYLWNISGNDTFSRYKDTFRYAFKNSGSVTVKLKPLLGSFSQCADSTEKTIEVVEVKPAFEHDCRDTKGSELVIQNKTGLDIPGYEWTLMDPVDSSEQLLSNATHLNYDFGDNPGSKLICLGINGGRSCGGKVCKTVLVQGAVYFANVFTPDESPGYNDTYRTPVYGYSDFEIRIFNRWGELVFHTKNPREEWNGKVANTGAQLPSGTYFYQAWYRPECSDEPIILNGSINLIR